MKSKVMKRAWQLAKQSGDTSKATFAICLTIAWSEVKSQTLDKKLIALGGKLWEKGDKKRIYLNSNVLISVYFSYISFYKSGYVSYCQGFSNNVANSIVSTIQAATMYYDLNDNTFKFTSSNSDLMNEIVSKIRKNYL